MKRINRRRSDDKHIYVCPGCKGQLRLEEGFRCQACEITFPILNGIPDFTVEMSALELNPHLQWVNDYYDRHARLYEWTRYPLRLLLYGGLGRMSFQKLMQVTVSLLNVDKGLVLDVACGPVTLGRRLASSSRIIYGTDLSMRMLRQGMSFVAKEQRHNVILARALAEALPFPDAQFDAALCGAALKLMSNPGFALSEIGRTMKEGAPLVGSTLIAARKGLFRFRLFRENARRLNVHRFTLPELEEYFELAGFERLLFQEYGSMILFRASRSRPD